MSTSFGDYGLSADMIEVIKTITRKEIERQRPAPKVAQVTAINEADKTLSVVYTGEQVAVKIPYANVVPAYVGQFVRINGTMSDRYVEAVLGTDVTGLTAIDGAALAEVANNGAIDAGDQATSVGSQLDTNLDAIRSNRPIGDGPDPTGESNIRWDSIDPAPSFTFGCGGTGHTHNDLRPTDYIVPTINVTSGQQPWAFIRCGLTRGKETISFAALTSGQVLTLVYDLYEIDSMNGKATRLYTSQNVASALSSFATFVQFNFPLQPSYAGKSFGIQFRMTGSGVVGIVGKSNVFPIPLPGLYPAAPGGMRTSGDAPDTLSASEMAPVYGGGAPYVQLGSVVGNLDVRRHWFDYANRPNGSPGSNWSLGGTTGGNFFVVNSGQFSFNGNSDGTQVGVWTLPMSTDYHRVYATYLSVTDRTGGLLLTAPGGLNSPFVTLVRGNNYIDICTQASFENLVQSRVRVNISLAAGELLGIRYDPSTNSYIGDRNGEDVPGLVWEDKDNYIPHGPGRRYVGQFFRRWNFGNSPRTDNWGADDL